MSNSSNIIDDCFHVRSSLLDLAFNSSGGQHLGGGLSMIEIMCTLYSSILRLPYPILRQK